MTPNTKENLKIKISCTQRDIPIDQFDEFATLASEKERNAFKASNARKQCFERNNYTCEIYGVRGTLLHAHHLESWHSNESLRHDVNNLVCLSEEAHRTFHYLHGNKNNTKQQFENFKQEIHKLVMLYRLCWQFI